jgi:predicted nuclease of restriction endonuclease-like (RecB) superfamily
MSDLITPDHDFNAVVQLIESAKQRASRAVNTELIDLYWAVGEYVSQKLGTEAWGKGTVEALADFIQRRQPGLRGFSAKNI